MSFLLVPRNRRWERALTWDCRGTCNGSAMSTEIQVSINNKTLLQLCFEESADKCYYKVSQIGAEFCKFVNKKWWWNHGRNFQGRSLFKLFEKNHSNDNRFWEEIEFNDLTVLFRATCEISNRVVFSIISFFFDTRFELRRFPLKYFQLFSNNILTFIFLEREREHPSSSFLPVKLNRPSWLFDCTQTVVIQLNTNHGKSLLKKFHLESSWPWLCVFTKTENHQLFFQIVFVCILFFLRWAWNFTERNSIVLNDWTHRADVVACSWASYVIIQNN